MCLLEPYFPEIETVVQSKGKAKLNFDPKEFVSILFKILPTIQLFGIKILLPKALRKIARPSLSMSLTTGEDDGNIARSSIISFSLFIQW